MDIQVGKKTIGKNHPAYIIAEAGVNHNNSLELAKKLIVTAAEAGADAIKFQTYQAEKLVTKTAPRFWEWGGEEKPDGTQFDSYKTMDKFPREYYPELFHTCEEHGIEFLSTPFDDESADFLITLGMKAIKVASSDLTDLPYLTHIAKSKLPIFLSTGASTIGEIEEAVHAITSQGNDQIVIMQCTLSYPTDYPFTNLRAIQTLAHIFPDYVIGLSEHTLGTSIPPAAVALGAKLIEKHYTVDKTLPISPDHHLSVDPNEMKAIVTAIRQVEQALGDGNKRVLEVEKITYQYDKRSLVSTQDIPAGMTIAADMITRKRPGTGIRPKFLEVVVGRKAQKDIPADTTLTWDMI
ncbi:MAG: NeuB family member [Candidatus Kaiserbacteria bacterium GW2011_GWA2_49_19]|uniref:NeuB family member n=1 Tax=Candidatus Kaiserbacteria bacterium GW2011_GWA2_49_19 TaxID=1618669 RepID=A0A0G1VRK5_9BACT|nr:MAG: NeuB family member [Candidatus Kaiserbacteria bacterium GW2011_GWA2_49_19]